MRIKPRSPFLGLHNMEKMGLIVVLLVIALSGCIELPSNTPAGVFGEITTQYGTALCHEDTDVQIFCYYEGKEDIKNKQSFDGNIGKNFACSACVDLLTLRLYPPQVPDVNLPVPLDENVLDENSA